MVSENNKRIAKNTILLYVRTFVIQLIALYTSRKILEILGIEDFGIYNVVGSVVGMLAFLNGSMTVATARFLTIELGKKNFQAYNRVFSMAVIIHFVIALIILLAAETIGLWFVNSQLNIPAERMFATNCVYQTSILIVLINIIQTPYTASLTAHEHFNVYAYVNIGEAVLKLVVVFLLMLASWDKLVVYGILLMAVQLSSATIYRSYAIKHFQGCRFCWQWNRNIFRAMFGFTSWNMLGTLAWLFKDQGSNMLMNIFGNPMINAARGISCQVSGATKNLVSGFGTAVSPQLTKNYAADNQEGLHKLLMTSSKISYILLFIITLPILLELPYILDLWLVDVPEHAVLFTRIIMIEALCDPLGNPMITSLMATGNIRNYQIVVGGFMLLNLPISYVFLRMGLPIFVPLAVSLCISVFSLILRLYFCKMQIALSAMAYWNKVVCPIIFLTILSALCPIVVLNEMDEGFFRLIVTILTCFVSVTVCAYAIGLSNSERSIVNNLVKEQIQKKRK